MSRAAMSGCILLSPPSIRAIAGARLTAAASLHDDDGFLPATGFRRSTPGPGWRTPAPEAAPRWSRPWPGPRHYPPRFTTWARSRSTNAIRDLPGSRRRVRLPLRMPGARGDERLGSTAGGGPPSARGLTADHFISPGRGHRDGFRRLALRHGAGSAEILRPPGRRWAGGSRLMIPPFRTCAPTTRCVFPEPLARPPDRRGGGHSISYRPLREPSGAPLNSAPPECHGPVKPLWQGR